jgi:hypothetical protein
MGDTSQQLIIDTQFTHLDGIVPLLGTGIRCSDSLSLSKSFILSLKINDVA